MLSEDISGERSTAAASRSSSVMVTLPPVVMLMTASQACLMRGTNCRKILGSGDGRPSFGSRACRCRIAAPACAASIACVAMSSGVNGSASDMVGVWIEPVIAQVMTTLLASWGILVSLFTALSRVVRARLLEMLHNLGPQRSLLFGGPFAEAFARFEAELTVRDKLFEIGRRARPMLDVWQHSLVDGQRQVGTDEVGILQRTKHREPPAERGLDHGVDGLGVADAALDQRHRLTPERVLQPVADEAGHILLHMRGFFAGIGVQLHGEIDRLR